MLQVCELSRTSLFVPRINMLSHRPAEPQAKRVFLAALSLYALVIWPILRADRFYIDDLGRARAGYLGWTTEGRPLSNFVVETLNLGTPISDLSPLPQLLALLLLAYLAVAIGRKFDVPGTWRAPLILAPLVANPFFLENLSYKFDVLPMVLATALSCMAVTAIPRETWRGLLGSLALLATLCLYQPAVNVFLVFTIAELVMGQRRLLPMRELLATLATRGGQLLLALLAYKSVAAATVKGHYAKSHGILVPVGDLAHTAYRNLDDFWRYVLHTLTGLWAAPMMAFIVAGALAGLFWSLRYTVSGWRKASAPTRLAMLAIILLLPPALVLAPWGPMLALQTPVLAPRVMIGVGALGAIGLLFVWTILADMRTPPAWQVAVLTLPVYGLLTFGFVYGASLKLQDEFERRVAAQLSTDLSRVAAQHPISEYSLQGSLGYAVVVRHTIKKYPLIAQLVPVYLTQGWGWGNEELRNFGVDIPHASATPRDAQDCEVVATSRDYRVYLDRDIAVISFSASQ
jgi:hypothetical protein